MRISEFIFFDWIKSSKIPETKLYHVSDKKVNIGDTIVFNEDNIFSLRSPLHSVMSGGKKTVFRIVENTRDGWEFDPSEKASRRLGVSPENVMWKRKKGRPMRATVKFVSESPQVDIAVLKKEE